jgi:hypothetical protein
MAVGVSSPLQYRAIPAILPANWDPQSERLAVAVLFVGVGLVELIVLSI